MLHWLSQIFALTAFNLRTLPKRRGSAVTAIIGIAGVVAVLVGVLSIGHGFRRTMTAAGSPSTAIVVRSGSDSETLSALSRDQARIIAEAKGIAREGDQLLVSPERFVVVSLPKRSTGSDAHLSMRGIEPAGFKVRDKVRIVEGRPFQWGRNEVIVGRGAALEFSGLEIGQELQFRQSRWKVVGRFEADGGLPESEIWCDSAVMASVFRRGGTYQSVLAKLASPGSFQQFSDTLTSDPRLNVKVQRETEYYAEQSRILSKVITGLGGLVSGLMAIGAIFSALNTMYIAVAARGREIATLKALGFHSSPVVISVLAESLLLAVLGGLVGASIAYLAFDGYRAATMNVQGFSRVAFAFDVNSRLLIQGILYAVLIGTIGGLFPAIRAARQPIAPALRAM